MPNPPRTPEELVSIMRDGLDAGFIEAASNGWRAGPLSLDERSAIVRDILSVLTAAGYVVVAREPTADPPMTQWEEPDGRKRMVVPTQAQWRAFHEAVLRVATNG